MASMFWKSRVRSIPPTNPGETCELPLVVNIPAEAPYTNTNTTCGMFNDYANTCLGTYDFGEDIIYQINITQDGCYNFTLDPGVTANTGFALDDACPMDPTSCVASHTSSTAAPHSFRASVSAGTYYLIIDSGSPTTCIPEYTLTIDVCPPPQPGENCLSPIFVNIPAELPYTTTGTTCGMFNDYSNSCLGNYDGGEDIIYELTVTEAGCYDFELDPGSSTWTGIAIQSACPTDTLSCVAKHTLTGSGVHGIYGQPLEAGTYYIIIDTWPSPDCIPSFTFSISDCAPPPANDDCVSAEQIGDVTDLPWQTRSASHDGPGTYITSNNIWYIYTPTCTGVAHISLCGSSFDTRLAVYDGATCDPLPAELATDDDACDPGMQSFVDVPVISGSQYLIEIGGYQSYSGSGVLTTSCQIPPANDDCANATLIGDVTDEPFSTLAATFDGYGTYITTPNVWFIYTATCTGMAKIDLCGSSFDTKLAVYDGVDCNYPIELGTNDDGCGTYGGPSLLYVPVIQGNQYLIEIGGSGTGDVGEGLLATSCSPPPANDNCAQAIAIGDVTDLPWSTLAASFDGGGTYITSPNIWYLYTPPMSGTAIISLCGSSFDTKLVVYDGATCDPLPAELARDDDDCDPGLQSVIMVPVVGGSQYLIEVGGYGSAIGEGVISTSTHIAPPNDNCAETTPQALIIDSPLIITGDNSYASQDCPLNTYAETWIVFSTAECMDVAITSCGTSPVLENAGTRIYEACPCDNNYIYRASLNWTDCTDGNWTAYFQSVPAGTHYYAFISDPSNDPTGPYTITVTGTACPPPPVPDFTVTAPGSWADGNTCGAGDDNRLRAGEDQVWAITIPTDGRWIFSLCGGSTVWDSYIYLGTQTYLGDLGAIDGGCGGSMLSKLVVEVTAGTYYLDVEGWYTDDCGPYTLDVLPAPPPAENDECVNALAVGNITEVPFTTAYATHDGPGTYMTGPNIWYLYTAPASGDVEVSLCGSSYDTKVAVYDGPTCDPLDPLLASDDDACDPGLQSFVTIPVIQGNQYLIEVGGYSTNVGDGVISISPPPPPPANQCESSTLIYTNGGPTTDNIMASQCDPIYPFAGGLADDFVLPGSGEITAANVVAYLGFWSDLTPATPLDLTAIVVTIYADNAGSPGGQPIDGDPNCAHQELIGGGIVTSQTIYPESYTYDEYMTGIWQVVLPISPTNLSAGTTYWLEVEPILDFTNLGQCGMVTTGAITGSAAMLYFPLAGINSWQIPPDPWVPADAAFCLLSAQGTIDGIVYNTDGITPLAGVHVITHDASETVVGDQYSLPNGTWTLNLPPGTYHEHLTMMGFVDYTINNIVVTSNGVTNLSATMQIATGGCQYIVGDANTSGVFNGLDVTYSVGYFKGGRPPQYQCECTPGHTWYVAGDVNASCSFNGLDVTYMVSFFKGGPMVHGCADCLPIGLLAPPDPDVAPRIMPLIKSNGNIQSTD